MVSPLMLVLLLHDGGKIGTESFVMGYEDSVKRAVYIAIASTCLCRREGRMYHAQLIRIQGESQVNAVSYLHVFTWRPLIFKTILAPSSRPLLSTLKVKASTSQARQLPHTLS